MYVPTNELWNEMLAISDKHYNFNNATKTPAAYTPEMRDSMRHTYARLNLIKYMTYSAYEQRYVEHPDSIMPAWLGMFRNGRPEFLREDVERNVIFEKELSNGTFKIVDKSPYSIFDLWHDTIRLEAEDDIMRTYISGGAEYVYSASKTQINKDSVFANTKISGNRYFELFSEKAATTVQKAEEAAKTTAAAAKESINDTLQAAKAANAAAKVAAAKEAAALAEETKKIEDLAKNHNVLLRTLDRSDWSWIQLEGISKHILRG